MSWKNELIRGGLALLRPFSMQHPATKAHRILVVSTTALGDTLWATPALESLRASFPKAYLAVLTSSIGFEVLKNNPWIDHLHLLKEPLFPRFLSLWRTLYREKFNTILLFHTSQRLALPLSSLLGATHVIGTRGLQKGFDDLLTNPLAPHYEHEIRRRLRMVEEVGGKVHSETLSFFFSNAERKSPSLPKEGCWVALHPGSKDAFRRWPATSFAKVGRLLKEKRGCEILITGTAEERPIMEAVAKEIPGTHLADTHLSLSAFAALLEKLDLLITNDTGPSHLAHALNRPVLSLHVSTDPELSGPHLAKKAVALSKPHTCNPCMQRGCQRPFCFLQITPDEVVDAAFKILSTCKK